MFQAKSEPCESVNGRECPQHYELCGDNTCVDSFVQQSWVETTGYPLYYSCRGECNHSSSPCPLANMTITCPEGYWLCQDNNQCVLSGVQLDDIFLSSLCDGHIDCKDGSDESYYQCLQVYAYETTVLAVTLLCVLFILTCITCCFRSNIIEIKFYGRAKLLDMQAKSFSRNEVRKQNFQI